MLKTPKIKYRKLQDPTECTGNDLLILAPGFQFDSLQSAVKNGLHVLALGLDKEEIDTAFPGKTKAGIWQNTYSYPAEGLGKNPLLIGISNADLFWRKPISATFFNESNAPALKYMESGAGKVVFVQAVPWLFDADEFQLRTTLRRNYGLISRLAHNLGAESRSGLLERLSHPPKLFFAGWRGKADPDRQGMQRNFFSPSFRPGADWKPIQVPGAFDTASNGLAGYDGDFWYRTTFNVPKIPSAKETTLFIGRVDDFSKVWLNGKFLGEVTDKTNPDDYWLFSRSYKIPSSLLRKQNNTLVVLCTDLRGSGGIFQTPWLQLKDSDLNLYSDTPRPDDDPYRYYHW
ncbi:hypothetical protein SDC9_138545 [bioreactor metagenome]|uniref:Beta-galactosidase jelly roll domain-containing protein n=1 Tax=bioreactor metagenome TaxID=1076179 RepID=A0A645DQ49_9ZZZZ